MVRRCNLPDLLSACQCLVGTLLDAQLLLDALPMISLWEHLAQHGARSVQDTVLARLARAQATTGLGCMTAACQAVVGLMAGSQLPSPELDGGLVMRTAAGTAYQASTSPCLLLQCCTHY